MTSKEGIPVLGFGREGGKELGQEGKVEIKNDLKLSSVILVFYLFYNWFSREWLWHLSKNNKVDNQHLSEICRSNFY